MSYWIAKALKGHRELVVPGQFASRERAVRYLDDTFPKGPATVSKYSAPKGRLIDPGDPVARPVEVWTRVGGAWSSQTAERDVA